MPRAYAAEEHALTDMDVAQEIMICQKNLAHIYTTAALECADPTVRRTFRQMGRDCERVAFKAFEILNERGHYPVKPAPASEIRQIEDMLDSFLRGEAVPPAQPQGRWGRPAPYEARNPYSAERPYGTERDRDRDRDRADLPEWARARV